MENVNTENVIYDNKKSKLHKEICKKLNDIYLKKNHDYGDSFGKSYKEYGLTMACIRLEDKLNRLKSLTKYKALVTDEGIQDTLLDLANYAIMTLVELNDKYAKEVSDGPRVYTLPIDENAKLEKINQTYGSLLPDMPYTPLATISSGNS